MASRRDVARAVLNAYGRTFAEELGIRVERNTPSPLFRLLCFSILASARISHEIAIGAARALADQGWTTARKMADSTWRQRTDTLNAAGYARYDESTARMLGDTAELLLDRWSGDLRKLREEAERDPAGERSLLKKVKGIGDVGANIFFREAQRSWDELYPFADDRVLEAAKRLDLGDDAGALTRRADGPAEYARLVAGLIRVDLSDAYDAVLEEA